MLVAQERASTELSSGWKFFQGHVEEAHRPDLDDSGWEAVSIPHDWAIAGPFIPDGDGNTGKLPWKGEGWYRKWVDIPGDDPGKTVYLLFDGVMAFPTVYLNGEFAGRWDYGYNSFFLDVTELIKAGEPNLLAVHADTRQHDSRWYPGAGIYRKVTMIAVGPVHVAVWGTFVTGAMQDDGKALVGISTEINNRAGGEKAVTLRHQILSGTDTVAVIVEAVAIPPGDNNMFTTDVELSEPVLWDTEHPHRYRLVTEILDGDRILDTYTTPFGIREMRFTADDGFHLNGRRVQFRGVNLHHDHGPLGAAFNRRAMERQLVIMKAMGCNAVRTSHNTAAPELLELCDSMGLLVFDEVFDKYDGKAGITDTTDFEDFARRNIRNFIMRDRNHPSVFIWSVGNEIGDVQWNIDGGFDKLQTMLKYVEMYDSTRATTLVCDSYESARLRHFDFYDVHSWNYGRRYSLAREMEPGKAVIISESASTLSSRGFYEFPLPEEKTDFTASLQVSSYDLNAPEWAELADDDFMWQQQEPYVAGEFVWTGFDYLGEPTPYNNDYVKALGMGDREASRSSYFGITDLCGIPKDRYYLYKSYWKPDETTVHILPHWNWPGRVGRNVPVFVYTNGDCAELFLNGRSLGTRCKKPDSPVSVERFRLMWHDVVYEPGELRAVAYKEGKPIGESVMRTTGDPVTLLLTPDRDVIRAGGKDLSYVLIEAVDEDGYPCPLADHEIVITLSGAGSIAGTGNGNPQSLTSFKSNRPELFHGKAMLIVSSGPEAGIINISASAEGLRSAEVQVGVE
jgi:beta-galactosidase